MRHSVLSICFVYAYVQLVLWKWEEKYVISVDLVGSRNWNGIRFDSKNSQLSLPDTYIKPCSLIISCAHIFPYAKQRMSINCRMLIFLHMDAHEILHITKHSLNTSPRLVLKLPWSKQLFGNSWCWSTRWCYKLRAIWSLWVGPGVCLQFSASQCLLPSLYIQVLCFSI